MTDAERLAGFVEVGRYLLEEFGLGDYVYNVRDKVRESAGWSEALLPGQTSWDHPDVVKFAAMAERLKELVG